MKITYLGVRGSIPVSGECYNRYGGNTMCVLVESGEHALVLDAGSGLINLPQRILDRPKLDLLLSHPHLDHMIGLPMTPYIFIKGKELDIHAEKHGGFTAYEQVHSMLRPPLWPIGTKDLPADVVFYDYAGMDVELDGFRVESVYGNHPGGVSVFAIQADGKKAVFATDCSLTESCRERIAPYVRNCDLLMCDGQYTDTEWTASSGYGHNCWRMAAEFASACNVAKLNIIHHDPRHTDTVLDELDEQLRAVNASYSVAREGETVTV